MPKLIVANWKMNPASAEEAVALAKESDVKGLIICPPFPFLKEVAKVLKNATLGAQDLFWEEEGAYTGEVSAVQLKQLGVKYVIIGHSERRQNLGETDEMVAKKVATALEHKLIPIVCVGETKEEHDAGHAEEVVQREIAIGLSKAKKGAKIVVAYEPIWAIGTGVPDDPANAEKMVQLIKKYAPVPVDVLYGGSVTAKNADDFLKREAIAGALVGGASLQGSEITKITEYANQ